MQFDIETVYGRLADALYRQEQAVADSQLPPAPADPAALLQQMALELKRRSVLHPGRAWALAYVMELVAQQATLTYWEGQAVIYQAWAANLWVKPDLVEEATDKAQHLFRDDSQWRNVTIWLKNAQPWLANAEQALVALEPLQDDWPQDDNGRYWFQQYLFSLAWAYLTRGQIEATLDIAAQAEAYSQGLNDPIGLARVPFLYGAIRRVAGQYQEAIEKYQQAAEQIAQTDGRAFAARIWCGYGYALRQGTNRFKETLLALQQAADLAQAADISFWVAMAINGQAPIYRYQGRLNEAKALSRQARSIFSERGAIAGLIESLMNSCGVYYELGQMQMALSYVQEGLLLYQQNESFILNGLFLQMNQGILEWQLGRYQKGLKALEEAKRAGVEVGLTAFLAEVSIYLAYIWYELDEAEKGQEAYEAARTTIDQLDNVYLQYNLITLESSFRMAAGVDDALVTDLEEHIQTMAKKGSLLYIARLTQLQAIVLIKLGRLDEAYTRLLRCLSDFQQMEMVGAQGESYLWLGHIQKERQNRQGAMASWEKVLELASQQPQTHWQAHIELARLKAQEGEDEQEALRHYEQALRALSSIRQMISQPALLSSLLLDAEQAVYEAIRFVSARTAEKTISLIEMGKANSLAVQLRQKMFINQHGQPAEVQTIRQKIFALQQELARESNRIARIRRQRDWLQLIQQYDQLQAEYERSQQALPADVEEASYFQLTQFREQAITYWQNDWLALDYFLHGDELIVVVVSSEDVWVEQSKVSGLPVLLDLLDDPTMIATTHLDQLAQMLLPQRACGRLRPETVVLIAPYGRLHNLPWAALQVDGRPLVTQCQPLITPALHLFMALHGEPTRLQQGLLTAVEEFPERPYAPLPFASKEATLIQQASNSSQATIAWRATMHTDATWEMLQAIHRNEPWEQFDCWHLATHAFFAKQANARACGLALYDQDIWLDDLVRLAPLPSLVTLSACSGLPTRVFPGDDHAGLATLCLAAGSKNVVGSLWKMRDDVSQELFVSFYQQMVDGALPLAALVAIQREMIAAGRPFTEWGGLRISGRGI